MAFTIPISSDRPFDAMVRHAAMGQTEQLRAVLAKGANPNEQRVHNSVLFTATQHGHTDCVAVLLEHGADPSKANQHGWAPLHEALRQGFDDLATLLVKSGADLKAQNNGGMTPLHVATQHQRLTMVERLLEAGAAVDPISVQKVTPLMIATEARNPDLVQALLIYGADFNQEDMMGQSSLDRASGWPEGAAMMQQRAQVKSDTTNLLASIKAGTASTPNTSGLSDISKRRRPS